MAEPQDIPQPNQEQEAILQRSPYLKRFLDHPPVIGATWLDDLEPLGEPIERDIAEKLGNNWWTTTLVPIALMAEEQLVKSLFLLGYELGNRKDAHTFSTPIIQKLSQHGVTHYPVPEGEEKNYWQRLFKTSWGIIENGAFIRHYIDEKNQPNGGQSSKDPFKDFIQGLESIDQLPAKDANS